MLNEEIILSRNALYGYKKGIRDIKYTSGLKKINDNLMYKKVLYIPKVKVNIDTLQKDTKNYYEYLKLKFSNVYCLNKHQLQYNFLASIFYNQQYKLVNRSNPYNIPIEIIDRKEPLDGRVLSVEYLNKDKIDILKKEPILFYKIQIGKSNNKFMTAAYIHELVHTQLLNQKGSVEDYLNNELLPVFLEILYADTINYDNIKKSRLNILKDNMELLKENENDPKSVSSPSIYIVSILKAFYLLDIYKSLNILGKRELLCNINKIFKGSITVENLLSKYAVNYESSIDNFKVLTK